MKPRSTVSMSPVFAALALAALLADPISVSTVGRATADWGCPGRTIGSVSRGSQSNPVQRFRRKAIKCWSTSLRIPMAGCRPRPSGRPLEHPPSRIVDRPGSRPSRSS